MYTRHGAPLAGATGGGWKSWNTNFLMPERMLAKIRQAETGDNAILPELPQKNRQITTKKVIFSATYKRYRRVSVADTRTVRSF